jgi:predicted RNA-binding Zn-ribbon protein involved in translation (DUF1610 family)
LAVDVQGATIVREHRGVYYNVLVYKQRCDACGYCDPSNSFAVAALPEDTYSIRAFACPSCSNHQVVRVRLGIGEEEVADFLTTE